MEPLLFEPYYLSPVWGGPRIAMARGLEWSEDDTHGESFDISAHPSVGVTIRNGPYAGMSLAEAVRAHHDEILGDVPDEAPIQVIHMDAREDLSVQVHPDEPYAQTAEGDHGKVEAWYVLAADAHATLIGGSTTSDLDALRAAAADDTIGSRYGHRLAVQEGDFILVRPGTLHALGAGILAVEIGSLGNTTYRICDWGRGRELHVEKGFDVLRCEQEATVHRMGAYDPNAPARERLGVDSGFYRSYVADVHGEREYACDGRYAVVTCVAGRVLVTTQDGSVELGETESCLVPACSNSYTISGAGRVLRSVRTPQESIPQPSER